MDSEKFMYDAFISYRHTELDKYVAETLHKKMESFKLPKNIAGDELKRRKIERVFRDKDELPLASNLEDPIINALENSEFLIVICSPRLPESIWCKKEIQTFIKMHGRKRVLAVLVEGEPSESFPEELLYDEVVTTDENGNTVTEKKPIEPLAADFRGKNKKEIDKAMKTEMLRLLAPIFGVGFDDLRQRHREQRIKKIIAVSSIAAIVGIGFGTISTAMAIRIHQQSELLVKQQVYALADKAMDYNGENDRKRAVLTAYEATTDYEGVTMPDTPEAERTLAKCLSVYDGGRLIRSSDQIELPGIVENFELSKDGEMAIASDNLGNVCVVRLSDREIVTNISESEAIDKCGFIDNESIYYISSGGNLNKVNINTSDTISYSMDDLDFVWSVVVSDNGSKMIVRKGSEYEMINTSDFSKIFVYDCEGMTYSTKMAIDEENGIVYVGSKEGNNAFFIALDINTGKELYKVMMPKGDMYACKNDGDTTYVLTYDFKNLLSGTTVLSALDINSGQLKYTKEFKSIFGTDMLINPSGQLLILGSSQALCVDKTTGEEIENFEIGEKIVLSRVLDSGDFTLYTSEGISHVLHPGEDISDFAFESIVCSDLVQLEQAGSNMAGIRKNDNRMIIFSFFKNMDSYIYEEELAAPLAEGELGEAAIEYGREKGIEKPSFIESYVEIPDINKVVISCFNGNIMIYNIDTMELVTEYSEERAGQCKYYGKANDYYLIEVGYNGYLLDKDGYIRADVDDLAGISSDNKCVVVYGRDEDRNNVNIAIPAYNHKELADKAKRNLERWNLK